MAASWYIVRTELRGRRRALLGLVLLAGLAGGLVLAAATGARRTDTAYDRFVAESNAGHVLVSSVSGAADYGRLDDVEGIEAAGSVLGLEYMPTIDAGVIDVVNIGSLDGRFGYEIDRPNVTAGRMPSPERDDELFVSRSFADDFGVEVGDRIDLRTDSEPPRTFPVTVVGIGAFTTDVVPTTDHDALPSTLAPPALTEAIIAETDVIGFDGASVVLRDPAQMDSVIADASAALGEELFVLQRDTTHETVERAIRPQATAMWAFAVVVAVASLLVVSQSVARHAAVAQTESAALPAVGVRHRELVLQSAILHALAGAAAAVVALVIAVGASPLFPIGRAAAAEVDPGLELNVAMLAAGAATIIGVATVAAAVGAWSASRWGRRAAASRPSALAAAAAATGASPRLLVGVRRAFEAGSGSESVPVRSGLVGAALAVAAVVATATFATSLDALVTEPERYGQSWAVAFDAQFAPAPVGELLATYRDDPRVTGIGGLTYTEILVNDRPVPTVALAELDGDVKPTILDGRAPSSPEEIAMGVRTMGSVGAQVGDDVAVTTPEGSARWTVVGTAVFPQLSLGSFSTLGLGTGALVHASAVPPPYDLAGIEEGVQIGELPPDTTPEQFIVDGYTYNAVLFAAEPADGEVIAAELRDHPLAEFIAVRLDQRPAAISTYADVRSTPVVLAVVLAGLGAGLVAHVLLTAVRRRRKELAVCRVIGMRSRDIRAIVRWQATIVAATAAVVGVPLGLAGGRMAWRFFAEDLGVPADAPTAWAWIAIAAAGALLLANAGAAIPGWRASRTRPATVLRAE